MTATPAHRYDAIVVGARLAGAATAMLLARQGRRVLVVDRAEEGSDTLSTLALMRGAVVQLHRWQLLDRLVATGTPPVRRTRFRYGDDEVVDVRIKPGHGVDALYAPRRTRLDPLLVTAARAAGADVRFGVTVTGLRRDRDGRVTGITGREGDGRPFEATAPVTIGADGARSAVARAVDAPVTRAGEHAAAVVYGFWSDVDVDGYEWCYRPGATAGLIPTDDGEVLVWAGIPPERFRHEIRPDVEAGHRRVLAEVAPEVAERVAAGRRTGRLRSFPGLAGFLRRPWGPGWALVGDAGYFKDPVTAHGMTDALRDAELVADAVDAALDGSGRGRLDEEPFRRYELTRDRLSDRLFTVTDEVAGLAWDLDRLRVLLLELSAAMNEEVEALGAANATGRDRDAVTRRDRDQDTSRARPTQPVAIATR